MLFQPRRYGEAWGPVPPQIFLSGHANKNRLSLLIPTMSLYSRRDRTTQRSPDPIAEFKGAYFWLNRGLSLTKNKVVFLRIACCNNALSLGQTDGHRYHDSPLPKTSSWMENCTKFGKLILIKIIKIVAASCQILTLKCTKFDFGWCSAPDPTGGAHSAPQTP